MGVYKEINRWQRRINFWKEIIKRKDLFFLIYRLKWELVTNFKFSLPFPVHIDLEINSNCNYRCLFCPHGTGDMRNDMPAMSLETAKKLLDELSQNKVYSIKLNWRGEPTLHPNLIEIISYARKVDIKEIQINTNGFAFNEEKIRSLIKAGLDRVIFSIDATTPELYAQIRVGGDYNRVVNNIKTFDRIRKELKQEKPFIRVQMVRTELNKHQVSEFRKMWQGVVDDVRVSDVTNRGQGDSLQVGDQVSISRTCCPQPWQRMMISCEGKVVMCCSDWFEDYVIGDISKNSLKEIWQGERLKEARKRLKKVDYNFKPCNDCWVKDSYIWKNTNK